MSKYSSLLFSPEKFHEIGPFRFPVYNDLVPGEARRMEELTRKHAKSSIASIRLAKKIAEDRSITVKEAVKMLSELETGENEELLYEYAAELEALQGESLNALEQQIDFVTLFMRYRGEVKLPKSKTFSQVSDWEISDTESMPRDLLDKVFEMVLWERDGWPTPGKETQSEVESPNPTK